MNRLFVTDAMRLARCFAALYVSTLKGADPLGL
jgi:hypothetical protein